MNPSTARWWTGVRPSKVWDFCAGLPADITFTRASSGTYVGADGLIAYAGVNVPRIQYSAGVCQGLLAEEARTNLAIQSQFASGWSATRSTLAANNATAPDGTSTAAKLTEDSTATSNHYTLNGSASTIVSGTTYTSSIYYKPNGRVGISVQGDGASGNLGAAQYFTCSGAGSVYTLAVGVTSASITQLANGWYRLIVTSVATGTTAQPIAFLAVANNAAYSGDGVSGGYLWGDQLEAGSSATSYIATTSASVTRSADVASVAVGPWFNAREGTFVLQYFPVATTGGALYTSPNSLGKFIGIGSGNNTGWYATGIASGSFTAGSSNRQAVSYDANGNMASSRDGAAVVSSAASDYTGVGVTTLNFGIAGSVYLNGGLATVKYYRRSLPNMLRTFGNP